MDKIGEFKPDAQSAGTVSPRRKLIGFPASCALSGRQQCDLSGLRLSPHGI